MLCTAVLWRELVRGGMMYLLDGGKGGGLEARLAVWCCLLTCAVRLAVRVSFGFQERFSTGVFLQ